MVSTSHRLSGARPRLDVTLYLVTDSRMCAPAGVLATTLAAVDGGVSVVQLRDPGASDADLVELGRQLVTALAGTGVPLLVNDRVHLVEAIGAQGAHVGQGDLDAVAARAVLGPAALLGLSVQTIEHVETALAAGVDTIDYLGVGPVWATGSKADAAPPGGLGRLRAVTAVSPWPCVAIGGIAGRRVGAVRAAGAAGVAVVSAICGQRDVRTAAAALRQAWDDGPADHAGVASGSGQRRRMELCR